MKTMENETRYALTISRVLILGPTIFSREKVEKVRNPQTFGFTRIGLSEV
jgi:hypothetical protein